MLQLVRPSSVFVGARCADQVKSPAEEVRVPLDTHLGAGDRVAAGVAKAPANQRTLAECEGPIGFAVSETRRYRFPTADRGARAQVVDGDFSRFAGRVWRAALRVVRGA